MGNGLWLVEENNGAFIEPMNETVRMMVFLIKIVVEINLTTNKLFGDLLKIMCRLFNQW